MLTTRFVAFKLNSQFDQDWIQFDEGLNSIWSFDKFLRQTDGEYSTAN